MKKSTKMNKIGSAIVSDKLIGIIILIVSIAAIVMAINYFVDSADPATREQMCRFSVLANSNSLDTEYVKTSIDVPLACHTVDLKTLDGDRERIKRQIAYYAAKCWYQYAEGDVKDVFNTEEGKRECGVCYTFTMPDKPFPGVNTGRTDFVFEEPSSLNPKVITPSEIYNYLWLTTYNPGIIYGGGSKFYIGSKAEFKYPKIDEPIEKDVDDIVSIPIDSYVKDYSRRISSETIQKLDEQGKRLKEKGSVNMLVLFADEFDEIDKEAAIKIIESPKIGLNSEDEVYDSLFIMVDLKNEVVRVTGGRDLEVFIKDFEIEEMLARYSSMTDDTKEGFENAVVGLTTAITNKLDLSLASGRFGDLQLPDYRSYYYYLSKGGLTVPIMEDNFEAGKTYAIVYLSATSDTTQSSIYQWISGDEGVEVESKLNLFLFNAVTYSKSRPNYLLVAHKNTLQNYCQNY